MAKWTITPLDVGELGYDRSEATIRRGMGTRANEKFVAWYLTDGEHNILVDCGPPDEERSKKWHAYTDPRISEDQQMVNIMKRLGLKCEDITLILLTHLHWDHASGVTLFPNAEIVISRTELSYAVCPEPIHYAGYEAPALGIMPAYLTVMDRVRTIKMEEQEILPGIIMFPTPGHSCGSMSVQVETEDGHYVITGDAVACYENMYGEPAKKIKYLPTGIYVNLDDMCNSMALIHQKADYNIDHVLPGHDSRVFRYESYPPAK